MFDYDRRIFAFVKKVKRMPLEHTLESGRETAHILFHPVKKKRTKDHEMSIFACEPATISADIINPEVRYSAQHRSGTSSLFRTAGRASRVHDTLVYGVFHV